MFPSIEPDGSRFRFAVLVLCALLVGIAGFVDEATGWELSFSILYFVPVSIAAWNVSRRAGIAMSFVCALVSLAAEMSAHPPYRLPAGPIWNASVLFGTFLIVTLQISALRARIDREKVLARTDSLTRVANSRAFYEAARKELARCRRYRRPLSLAYLDLDGFKQVNDRIGHLAGDALLTRVARVLLQRVRETDIVARMGGDEFAILFPETAETDAATAMAHLRAALAEDLAGSDQPVTASVGLLTCLAAPPTVEDMVRRADHLMYDAKSRGKDGIVHQVFDDPPPSSRGRRGVSQP